MCTNDACRESNTAQGKTKCCIIITCVVTVFVPFSDYYQVELTSSYSMLRLISFSTCVIRLLGTAFSTLRLQRYKEFNKRIGRCIRCVTWCMCTCMTTLHNTHTIHAHTQNTHTHITAHHFTRAHTHTQTHTLLLIISYRLIVQFVADHWLAYKSYQVEQLGLQMNQFPYSVLANEPRYTLNRLQLEVDYFILRATRWIMMGHKLVFVVF